MKTSTRMAVAVLFAATAISAAPAFAAEKHMMSGDMMTSDDHMMSGDKMISGDKMMHRDMMHGQITCSAGMSDTGGMMIEFHNMGKDAVPAGSMAHWMLGGVAQGDMHFMDAVAPGGMKTQNYAMMKDHMTHMPSKTHCMVEMKQ